MAHIHGGSFSPQLTQSRKVHPDIPEACFHGDSRSYQVDSRDQPSQNATLYARYTNHFFIFFENNICKHSDMTRSTCSDAHTKASVVAGVEFRPQGGARCVQGQIHLEAEHRYCKDRAREEGLK